MIHCLDQEYTVRGKQQMSLEIHRKRIDEIDEKLTQLFLNECRCLRISLSTKGKGASIRDPEREREKLPR